MKKHWTTTSVVVIIRFTTKKEVMQLDALQASDSVLLLLLITAVVLDFKYFKISNRLILTGYILALIIRCAQNGPIEFIYVLVNISIPVIVLYLFYRMRAIGAGDIKLFSMVGSFVNLKEMMVCIGVSFVIGAVLALGKLLYARNLAQEIWKGGNYIWGWLQGREDTYAWTYGKKGNVMHFSIAILLGVMAMRIYEIVM